jgi:hypothetical protein
MNLIDIQSVQKLEEYIFALGAFSASIKSAHELQSKALDCEFLEGEERELVETIRYQLGRSIVAISDLLRFMDQRAVINAEEVGERMLAKCRQAVKQIQDEQ